MNFTMPWANKPPANNWTAPIEDVKQQIGKHVDNIAQAASQLGREVAQQAASVTHDAGSTAATAAKDLAGQAVKQTQNAGAQAAAVAKEVPGGASTLAQQAMRGASQLGRELRAIRVTREPAPAQRGPDVIPGVALLAGLGGGLALMFFFDPEQGRRRRALLRDQLTKWTRIGERTASGKAKDLRNRTVGLAHEARKVVSNVGGGAQDEAEEADELPTQPRSSYSYGSTGNGPETVRVDEGSVRPMTSEVS